MCAFECKGKDGPRGEFLKKWKYLKSKNVLFVFSCGTQLGEIGSLAVKLPRHYTPPIFIGMVMKTISIQ